MAKEKQDINPEQFNEFLNYVAQKGPPVGNLSDIFRLGKDSGSTLRFRNECFTDLACR